MGCLCDRMQDALIIGPHPPANHRRCEPARAYVARGLASTVTSDTKPSEPAKARINPHGQRRSSGAWTQTWTRDARMFSSPLIRDLMFDRTPTRPSGMAPARCATCLELESSAANGARPRQFEYAGHLGVGVMQHNRRSRWGATVGVFGGPGVVTQQRQWEAATHEQLQDLPCVVKGT